MDLLSGQDRQALEGMARVARSTPAAIAAAFVEDNLRWMRELGVTLGGSRAGQVAHRARRKPG